MSYWDNPNDYFMRLRTEYYNPSHDKEIWRHLDPKTRSTLKPETFISPSGNTYKMEKPKKFKQKKLKKRKRKSSSKRK